ncbi:MAG: aminotransferase class III-fold pyridoxal phosphate-dependent enzyme [Microbacteriaceae bacterium]|jgi:taurine--2-oxoglutarate transaminase|nr:aminotransferase class III-fold pyridoxal phosphate-dependent enzyme [Microbacteriaceae bacterium]MCI1207329.1 aminotransferase class III-fold pyridoxal phosphate-dependent enzyme [Microbacteriaceae bacterium]
MDEYDETAVLHDDAAYVLHSWSAQKRLHPIDVVRAQGVRFWDASGKEYLDFASQLINLNLGHQHPDLVQAACEQVQRLCTIAPEFANGQRSTLARLIVQHGPIPDGKVFFTNAGADANENAVRLAREATGRTKVLASYRSYHGATGTAVQLTGEGRRTSQPVLTDPNIVHFWGPYPYRSIFYAATPEEETARSLEHLEQTIRAENPQSIAAIILETVVGTNGVLVPPPGYLQGVRALADRYGIMYIADEVMVGFGRTGSLFAVQRFGVQPDLLTFAKGVNSGYSPLGGVILSPEIAAVFDEHPYPGGLTYSGHPLGCAIGVRTFEVFERDHLLEHVRDLEARVLQPWLRHMAELHPSVGEARGVGLFAALELVSDRASRAQLGPIEAGGADNPLVALRAAAIERGLWPVVHGNRVHIAPPLIIDETDLRAGLDILDEVLSVADAAVRGPRVS